MSLKAMIVDDEPFVRDDLRHLLSQRNEIEVVCEAGTVVEAKKLLAENRIDVVFLDIQLRGGSGFDLVPFIHSGAKIIFVTAFDAYAVRAFEVNALDYVLKPVTEERLSRSLQRLATEGTDNAEDEKKTGPFEPNDRIFVRTDSGMQFVGLVEICAISSIGGNYAALHLSGGNRLLTRKTLKAWEEVLPSSAFFRIHRGVIVRLDRIERVENDKDGLLRVYLTGNDDAFDVSRRTAAKFKERMKRPYEPV
jgi:two-component system LytT family response regulator